ncbi:type VI secretion system baseplate subunit TssF [Alienimonas californiensis]|uniref:Type VI secretion protein, VC_A0110 family n=1 Tax=Alienimonas californiensis TaxID=2527989 RepID=A0A517P4F4_9PLAN|nr:type VI secretion system baseplate subunit TssF [Alienimonas californiensis]QDT14264.1 hypothetical protein CA12_03350 [Alienimonas californiensis]
MRDDLERLYESELAATRGLASEFGRARPKIADRLVLDGGKSEDPHVERLIQAFAFLTARVRLKLEDEFPELTDALLSVLYPHYLAPVPAMGVVQFRPDPSVGPQEGPLHLPRGTMIRTAELDDPRVRCRFRTAAALDVWPLEVSAAAYATAPFPDSFGLTGKLADAPAAVRFTLRSVTGRPISELRGANGKPLDVLRLHLADPDGARTGFALFDLFASRAETVAYSSGTGAPGTRPIARSAVEALVPAGFDDDEALLPSPGPSFPGYRLLTEYFAFPERFLFFDLRGLAAAAATAGPELTVTVLLSRSLDPAGSDGAGRDGLAGRVGAGNLQLGCVPVVNLFSHHAEPRLISHRTAEYPVVPDYRRPRGFEVYSVDAVTATDPTTGAVKEFAPYYGSGHGGGGALASGGLGGPDGEEVGGGTFFHARRRPSLRARDAGSDVSLTLVDLAFNPRHAPPEVVACRLTCTNRDLPHPLTAPPDWGLQLEEPRPIRPPVLLGRFSAPRRVPADHGRWRLISHLALNHLSLTGGADGAAALREILALYGEALTGDPEGARAAAAQIAGIVAVNSRRSTKRVPDGRHAVFARGVEITLDLDRARFTGGSGTLFANVLDRFVSRYASLNSFTQLRARWSGDPRPFRVWPVRAGGRDLV